MVDDVIRLKLALLGSAFRGARRLARTGLVAVLIAVFTGAVLDAAQSFRPEDDGHRAGLIVITSILALALAICPLTSGLGSALEPRRFAPFPIAPGRLAATLALAGAVGVQGLLTIVLVIALGVSWAGTPFEGAAVGGGLVGGVAIVLTGQFLVAIAAQLAVAPTTARTVALFARGVVGLCLAAAITTALVVERGRDDARVDEVAAFLSSSPLGLPWAVAGSEPPALTARMLGAIALVGVLALGWRLLVGRLLEAPERQRWVPRSRGLGVFDLVPATQGGVIAARSILYWTRDPRYRLAILALPVAPALMMIALAIAGVPGQYLWLIPIPVLALFLGWFSHNDVAYDHTAVWLHVAAHVRGASDRWGRAVPPLLLGVPLVVLLAPLFAVWSGIEGIEPALLGTSLGLLLTGIGVSSVASAAAPYPAPRPGAGPFDQPPLTAASAGWSQGLSLLAIIVLMSPTLHTAWRGATGETELLPAAAIAGAATGVVMLALGVLIGGRVFRRRAPELLDLVLRS
ncbi:hypothetical protein [Yonghaparkia sp. Soil809]|uniref:hypothetical protein n=1 Tax=Yonghaparkia sp. Soil809 TaxID=1736417 RepID=UPI0006F803C6|nr:hypothetical protein [Yonghaparkia sp. Soil809]KRF32723.1 hypothetical protein ASG83_01355 [Yonghaparkia sp. Soil809]